MRKFQEGIPVNEHFLCVCFFRFFVSGTGKISGPSSQFILIFSFRRFSLLPMIGEGLPDWILAQSFFGIYPQEV